MRAFIALLVVTTTAIAERDSYRPLVPPDNLPELCAQMEFAAKWLAQYPDDPDDFLDRYLENGTAVERVLADLAVRQSLGIQNSNSATPASVRRECISLMRQMEA